MRCTRACALRWKPRAESKRRGDGCRRAAVKGVLKTVTEVVACAVRSRTGAAPDREIEMEARLRTRLEELGDRGCSSRSRCAFQLCLWREHRWLNARPGRIPGPVHHSRHICPRDRRVHIECAWSLWRKGCRGRGRVGAVNNHQISAESTTRAY